MPNPFPLLLQEYRLALVNELTSTYGILQLHCVTFRM